MSPTIGRQDSELQAGPTGAMHVLRRRWGVLLVGLAAGGLFGTGLWVLFGRTYTATAAFVVSGGRTPTVPSSLAGLASQFGIALPSQHDELSPQLLAGLVETRELSVRVLRKQYPTVHDSVSLLRYLGGDTTPKGEMRSVRRLRRRVETDINVQNGIVRIGMRAQDPVLAAAVTNALVAELASRSHELRQAQARGRRVFLESRVEDARSQLARAELKLKDFYERNRQWRDSPQLTYQEGALSRQVELETDVYVALRRDYDKVVGDEVDTSPTIVSIDEAIPPVRRDGPLPLWVLLGSLLGIVSAGSWVLIGRWFRIIGAEIGARPEEVLRAGFLAESVGSPSPRASERR